MCLGSVYRCSRMLWCRCSLQHCSTLDKLKTVKLFIIKKMVRVAGDGFRLFDFVHIDIYYFIMIKYTYIYSTYIFYMML